MLEEHQQKMKDSNNNINDTRNFKIDSNKTEQSSQLSGILKNSTSQHKSGGGLHQTKNISFGDTMTKKN